MKSTVKITTITLDSIGAPGLEEAAGYAVIHDGEGVETLVPWRSDRDEAYIDGLAFNDVLSEDDAPDLGWVVANDSGEPLPVSQSKFLLTEPEYDRLLEDLAVRITKAERRATEAAETAYRTVLLQSL